MAHRPGLRRRPTALPVAKADIATFDDIKALVVERFDRRWAEDRSWIIRLPQEDMCQALGVPPALKYECDGGPGIERIMELLFGSSEGLADRRTFMATQVVFWLLGAIDGHAKNFSIFLLPGGGFRLTPAYDIISAYPLVAKQQQDQNNLRMAMAFRGRNRHYHWAITPSLAGDGSCLGTIVGDLLDRMDGVIQRVTDQLPPSFPADVAEPILDGMREARDRLARSRFLKAKAMGR